MNNTELLNRLLNGISKSLSIINKAIPIYQDYKPLVNNIKSVYSSISSKKEDKDIKIEPKKEIKKETISNNSNSPQFFI